jgi:hypothetical protein
LESLKGRDYSEYLHIDGRIILKWISRKRGGRLWSGFIRLRMGPVTDSCEHGDGPLGFIKGGKFLDWLSDYQLLKKDCSVELVVLYGHEAWSLTLGEEHRLMVFQNKVLTRIFVPRREEVTG